MPTSSRAGPRRMAAVIPVLDEETAIGDVVSGLAGTACCVFVVDGGSRDATVRVAADAGAWVIHEPRRGYGRACITGTEAALAPTADAHVHDAVAFLDGDGSCDPRDIAVLAAALGGADMVLGRRPGRLIERGAMPWHARTGNALVATLASGLTGRRIHDLPPAKVIAAHALRRLGPDDDRYGWTVQLIVRALADRGLAVREVDVAFRGRRGGTSKVSGSVRASAAAARAMIGTAVREWRPRPVVALMAKAPRAGHAKTRLARDLGDELTASLWAASLADSAGALARAADAERLSTLVVVPGPADVDPVSALVGPGWAVRVQDRPGLGGALADAFLAAFDAGADRAVAVAGDSPSLPPTLVRDAFAALARDPRGAVLGPTTDGGYHLIGLRWRAVSARWHPRLREPARRALAGRLSRALSVASLGGEDALLTTRRGLVAEGWRPVAGAAWPDLDTLGDLAVLAPGLRRDPSGAPRTAAWIARHQAVIEPVLNGPPAGRPPAANPAATRAPQEDPA